MTDPRQQAREIIDRSLFIDTLGGAIVHPTPHVDEGTYQERVLGYGSIPFGDDREILGANFLRVLKEVWK